MTDDADRPVTPRPAATLLLVRDDPYEVLMVRRHARASFASALVFPGGVVEPDDDSADWDPFLDAASRALHRAERALRIAAIRETWEETGVLLARTRDGAFVSPGAHLEGSAPLDPDAHLEDSAHLRGRPLIEVLAQTGGRLRLGDVHPFGHWITPANRPKRWDTRFFVAEAPTNQTAQSDGTETVAVEWVDPAHAVASAVAAEHSIVFPTLMNLARLAETTSVQDALTEADRRPHIEVNPVDRTGPDGVRLITIPAEARYALTEYPIDNN
ncbi:hypothetical protein B7R22_11485 [Subtercola boreus]|uniref:Nudix hydrolase domain-containing protein n=1 Tax=Subtercola boreus TaxID=120213 RepID=A0A3E0VVW7_9MICO|nr:NUDIX hydrolase [Subtercola boreus]RFA13840.1 hypothetical protein B7R22_11485 [Subtercola boreus]